MKKSYTLILLISLLFLVNADTASSQCFNDGHSPFVLQGWKSCTTSVGPIESRGDRHWVLYDLGHIYNVDSIYIWNHNVWGETGNGVKDVIIDYSTDMINWSTIGPFTVEQAPGSWKYTGTYTLDMFIAKGRYFLFTIEDTWDSNATCAGLGEIKFLLNPSVGTDDQSPISDWEVYPNPTYATITINITDYATIQRASVYNSLGHLVNDIGLLNSSESTIDFSDYPLGMYFITLENEIGRETKSFIKIE